MRKTMILVVLMGLMLSPMATATADPTPLPVDPQARVAMTALNTAQRVLAGDGTATDPSATIALRDLWMARPDLQGDEATAASSLLARPTDGPNDPFGNGYTVPSQKACGAHICVHYVLATADAPPNLEWVSLALATMENVYEREVNQLGFRPPRADGVQGGDGKLDVYLKDLGAGLYGYCAAEFRKSARTASGFCVLDNDYSPAQFPQQTPQANLTVTAAHEFFHAVQYSYDYKEDPWMLESTATWMEEQVADDINDNRQYLQFSQLQAAFVPLDAFSTTYGFQYGNWIFWEYLTSRFGTGFVKKAWQAAAKPRRYSIQAIESVLRKKRTSFAQVYADFAAANVTPSRSYAEAPGVPEFADPPVRADTTLSRSKRSRTVRTRLNHLSASAIHLRPDAGLGGKKWKLRVSVRAPRRAAPQGRVLIHKTNGKMAVRKLKFNKRGKANIVVLFSAKSVAAASVSFANVSTRYRCGTGTDLVCAGTALDDKQRFVIKAKAVKKTKKKRR